jgi:hypothetical protein
LDALVSRLRAKGELPGMAGGYREVERDAVLAAQWAKTWRDLQAEAINIANRMKDPGEVDHVAGGKKLWSLG